MSNPLQTREPSLEALRERGFTLHERGELAAAETLYREILARTPADGDVRHAFGVLALQGGRYDLAHDLLSALLPRRATAAVYGDLGSACLGLNRCAEAVRHFDAALQLQPDLVAAHLNRGAALRSLGRMPEALASFRQAATVAPLLAAPQLECARLLLELQRPEEALECYERALSVQPDDALALNNRGGTLFALGRIDAALRSFERALECQPQLAQAHLGRARALAAQQLVEAALESYSRCIELTPGNAVAHFEMGNLLSGLQRWPAALQSYDAALAHKRDYAAALCNRGLALQKLHRDADALLDYDRAIALDPGIPEAWCNRGAALQGVQRLAEALESCDRALALKPDYAQALMHRANVRMNLEHWDAALADFDRALAIDATLAAAHANRAVLQAHQQRLDEALSGYERALALQPDTAEFHVNRAMALLAAGRYAEGWEEYEWRHSDRYAPSRGERRDFARPRWSGADSLLGRTLLLYGEQGLGDTIQFCRYAAPVAELGARVVLEVPAPLWALLSGLVGVAELVRQGDPLPAFDYQCSLLSLPHALRTRSTAMPGRIPYIGAPADRARLWQARLGPRSKPRVGLVWSGGFRPNQPELWPIHRRRNIPLRKFEVLEHSGIEFYSLQKGEPAGTELAELRAAHWNGPAIIDHTEALEDFADTAALIAQLDLVISVDTSTAHLAGALGKPVWLLNRFDSCWRWMLHGSDTPWYPSMRLYRQERPGDWDGVLQRVRRDLLARDFEHETSYV